jgi:hypothetical protein
MGMDVYGNRPTAEAGEYFRNSVWSWHPLWDYCCEIDPQCVGAVENGHSNDGDGLDAVGSLHLAGLLQAEIDSGATAKYSSEYEARLNALSDETCKYCNGTGDRPDLEPADWKKECNGCNSCHGKGTIRPLDTRYPFSVENVTEFVAFLRDCGGFRIC